MNVKPSVAAGLIQLGERDAHDTAPAGESPDAQLALDLDGIATARGDPGIPKRPLSVEQAGAQSTLYPLRKAARTYETAYRAAIDFHGQADRPDGLAVATAANDLFGKRPAIPS